MLKSTPEDNSMVGMEGNDTYTNFVKPNPGFDSIDDAAGTDKLVLTNYTDAETPLFANDANNNGNIDSLYIDLPPKDQGNQVNNGVLVFRYFDDTKQQCPCGQGPGYIETIQISGGAGQTGLK